MQSTSMLDLSYFILCFGYFKDVSKKDDFLNVSLDVDVFTILTRQKMLKLIKDSRLIMCQLLS